MTIFCLGVIIGLETAKAEPLLFNSKESDHFATIQIKDLSLEPSFDVDIDSYYIAPVDKQEVQSKNKNTELSITPGEDLYKLFEDNKYDIMDTIKNLDLKKPPVKTELKIRF
ncbi:MAG: hypothetical protein A2381_08165 [Bdellovibrionales bacterium RIFOXYB1_FULL_37_110]|nr:MAG: hypothetical protein A2181_04930 [Bdellovibrionales bacterium RIFOXYA1_FULL_38_20]OFZ52578.1 MAG: hypothetical protein A2417_00885 [Bdellovibrionales bacterium RIFOXYC1_FULL_37_79]OFZ59780.1 MAG: hypothetical protein A2381_08165 [Bdellovibrionales bacterium RIFOXYB1_FULL_37_110]